jgi:ADP-ribose pyrophosphatase YjhB (NUDIX family)
MPEFNIPNAYYRVSIKALILDETRTKFLITLEDNGKWELPGGGMDWGETPDTCLKREIREEMGLEVTEVAPFPSYYLVGKNMESNWTLNLIFEIKVRNLDFTSSDECTEIKFVAPNEVDTLNAFRSVKELAAQFDPKKHNH